MSKFKTGTIEGVIWRPLSRWTDSRGWLIELFRNDELLSTYHPVMGYISMTESGVARGPHEHEDQADLFCFLGPSNFKLYLWDNRPKSPTFEVKQTDVLGTDKPMGVIIPPGVVHAYKNVGTGQGIVVNCPNQLYRGVGRKQAVDEIRHEDQPDTPYHLD